MIFLVVSSISKSHVLFIVQIKQPYFLHLFYNVFSDVKIAEPVDQILVGFLPYSVGHDPTQRIDGGSDVVTQNVKIQLLVAQNVAKQLLKKRLLSSEKIHHPYF